MKKNIFLLLILISSLRLAASTIIYVKSDGSLTSDGLSWNNAVNIDRARVLVNYYNNLSTPIETELWLKNGTYNLNSALNISLRINIYGGFKGTETLLSDRNWFANQTIFNQNSSAMVIWGNTADNVLLDGLILQGGRPTGAGGCGQIAQGTTLRNCIIRNNKAGTSTGVLNFFAISGSAKKITLENCLIINNESVTSPAVFNAGSAPVDLINCTIANNMATTATTAIINTAGVFNMYNCILFGNKNGANPAKAVGANAAKILKNNAWDVAATDGTLSNNILLNTSPFNSATSFVGAANGGTQLASSIESADFKLMNGSACINTGDNSFSTATFDIAFQPRINGSIDMGCYEDQSTKLSVSTQNAHVVGYNNAQIIGSINTLPFNGITQHGHCWSTTISPTISNDHTELGILNQPGSFTSQITGLNMFTTYYVRSYIRTSDATIIYGNEVNLLTMTNLIKLAGVFTNNMVLQQNSEVELWGWSAPLDKISIVADWGSTAKADVDATGRWRAKLVTPLAISGDNTGHSIVISGKNNVVTLSDVLIGDVWLFRGQSNMGYTMGATSNTRGVIDAETEIPLANYPQIRLFKAPLNPQSEEVEYVSASWSKCTPEYVRYYSAVAYYFSRKVHVETGIPIGIILTAYGSSTCEAWTKKEVLNSNPILKKKYLDPYILDPTSYNPIQTSPTLLYNGMVAPIKKFTAKGLVWYQGEGNSNQPDTYPLLWSVMINNFRSEWGQGNLPVYYVQLPSYSLGGSWHVFRNAQTTLLTIPNTGMVVSCDLTDPDPADIHPMVKKPIAERLALWSLAKDYGKNIIFSGPILEKMTISGSKIILNFQQSTVGSGLKTVDNSNVREFQIAGADKVYYPATATIVGKTIEVFSNQVSQPLYVRYAYSPTPDPNLINNAGLPTVPFNSETWNYNIKITSEPNITTGLQNLRSLNYKRVNNGIEIDQINPNSVIRLFDISGKLIYSIKSTTEKVFIPINNKGIYIIALNSNNQNYFIKTVF